MAALFKLDAVLSNTITGKTKVTAKEVVIVRAAIKSLMNEMDGNTVNDVVLDSFIIDMIYSYSLKKTSVVMDLCFLDYFVKNKSFLNIFLNPLWKQDSSDTIKEGVNV